MTYIPGSGGTLTLDDGTTTVTPVDTLIFDGGTLVDDTGGQATYTPPSWSLVLNTIMTDANFDVMVDALGNVMGAA